MSPARIYSSILLSLCHAASSAAADRFDDIRAYIRAELVQQSVPSIAVAVAQDGKIIWEEGFGWADREQRIPATEHTLYWLASISKPITATGLMILAQAGKIDLDAPANDYLGNAKLQARIGAAHDATVRRIANHTSGLPPHHQFFYADEPYEVPSMDETIMRYAKLVTAPAERYSYSNLGYGVLGYIIERVSGRSYAEFMRREVFIPLGLTRTSVNIGPGLAPYAATRYGKDGLPLPFYDFDHPGASAIFSSAHDLVRYGLFNLKAHLPDQKAILSDAAIDAMHRSTASTPDGGYGIGFEIRQRNGYHVVEHDGGMDGVSAEMHLFPAVKTAIVVLSNGRSNLPLTTADRIASKLLPKWQPAARHEWPAAEPFVTPPQLLGAWKGVLETYVKDVPLELIFLPDGNVHAKVDDQPLALVNRPSFKDGRFKGDVTARVGTPDTDRYVERISLSVMLRDDVLNGTATASGRDYPRLRNWLQHWVELKKIEDHHR